MVGARFGAAAGAGLGCAAATTSLKRSLIHVAGHNLGLLMRRLTGAGTPKEAAARSRVLLFVAHRHDTVAIVIFALDEAGRGILVVTVTAEPTSARPTHRQQADKGRCGS